MAISLRALSTWDTLSQATKTANHQAYCATQPKLRYRETNDMFAGFCGDQGGCIGQSFPT